jgi:lipopolysaccharide transport system permease protein
MKVLADTERAIARPAERDGRTTLLLIRPAGRTPLRLREVWQYRELLYFLAWRDITVRYKQTALGITWAVIQPVLTTVVFSIFFGRLAGMPSDGLPYPLFALCALLPWQLFAHALAESSNSLVANQNLITKVYFPRLVIPASAVLASLVDFLIAFAVLIGLMGYYRRPPTASAWSLPLFVLLAVALALGVGLWLSALNVQYRDVRYTIPFLTQLWLFATPIAYPSSLVPQGWQGLLGVNPMAGVVEGFRWSLLGARPPSLVLLAVSVLATLVLLLAGLWYFRRMERTFADLL